MKTKLPKGTHGFFREDGTWQCTGAAMGRRNAIPDSSAAPKLHLYALKWTDGDYDEGGAYWGNPRNGERIYRAEGDAEGCDESFDIYIRAKNRNSAKELIRSTVPAARFYR